MGGLRRSLERLTTNLLISISFHSIFTEALPAYRKEASDDGLNDHLEKLLFTLLIISIWVAVITYLVDVFHRHPLQSLPAWLQRFCDSVPLLWMFWVLRLLLATCTIIELVGTFASRLDIPSHCGTMKGSASGDDEMMNADIGGIGVRVALYMTALITIISTILCRYSSGRSEDYPPLRF